MGFGFESPSCHSQFPFFPLTWRDFDLQRDSQSRNLNRDYGILCKCKSKKGNGSGSSCSHVDSAIQWINHYRVDKYQPRSQGSLLPREPWERGWIGIRKKRLRYPLDRDLSSGKRYSSFEQPGPGRQNRMPNEGERFPPFPSSHRPPLGGSLCGEKEKFSYFFAPSPVAGV